jgi:hypothetical protein
MVAREGEAAKELGEPAESELSSGGGVGGSMRDLAGTDLDRNLGMGSAEGAGEAWKVGPAYAPWFLAGVAEMGRPARPGEQRRHRQRAVSACASWCCAAHAVAVPLRSERLRSRPERGRDYVTVYWETRLPEGAGCCRSARDHLLAAAAPAFRRFATPAQARLEPAGS